VQRLRQFGRDELTFKRVEVGGKGLVVPWLWSGGARWVHQWLQGWHGWSLGAQWYVRSCEIHLFMEENFDAQWFEASTA
jgi:hypothetical protein